jgi:putative Ca2+/H+ antiporter (TMEM165/GDT1 family)
MSPNVRKSVYTALLVLNAVLVGCVQENMLPASWGQIVAVASFAVAAAMKEFAAPAAEKSDEK